MHMVTNLSAPTFALLSANPKEAFNQDYDVVQDYFSIIEQCGRVSPTLLVVAKVKSQVAVVVVVVSFLIDLRKGCTQWSRVATYCDHVRCGVSKHDHVGRVNRCHSAYARGPSL